MSAKKNKEKTEASLLGIIISGLSMASVGAFCGVLFLTGFTPKVFSSVKDRENFKSAKETEFSTPGEAFYYSGNESGGGNWQAKRAAFIEGSVKTIEFSSAELNSWMRSKFQSAGAPTGGEKPKLLIVPGAPNFYVAAGESLYVSLPLDVSVFGNKRKMVVFTEGRFSEGGFVEFEPEAVHINSAPVPGIVGDHLLGSFVEAYAGADEFLAIQKAWSRVTSVALSADGIRVQLR